MHMYARTYTPLRTAPRRTAPHHTAPHRAAPHKKMHAYACASTHTRRCGCFRHPPIRRSVMYVRSRSKPSSTKRRLACEASTHTHACVCTHVRAHAGMQTFETSSLMPSMSIYMCAHMSANMPAHMSADNLRDELLDAERVRVLALRLKKTNARAHAQPCRRRRPKDERAKLSNSTSCC